MTFWRYPLLFAQCLTWLLMSSLTELIAQPTSKPVTKVIFKDRVFANIVQAYINQKKAKAIRIQIETTPKGYLCRLLTAHYYEYIAELSPTAWAQWQNCLLVFEGDSSSLARMCTFIRPASSISLLAHLQRVLPDDRPSFPKSVNRIRSFRHVDDWGWIFKMEGGRDVWFSVDGGYTSEADVPDSLPPVPESKPRP